MSDGEHIHLGFAVLDRQILDKDGRRCGRVDDIELGESDGRFRVQHLLTGPGAWPSRLQRPFGATLAWLFGNGMTPISMEYVQEMDQSVRLNKTAEELELGEGDSRLGRLIKRLPFS